MILLRDYKIIINLILKRFDFIKMINSLIRIGRVTFLKKTKGKPALLTRICPPGVALAGPDMTEVRVSVQFRTYWAQN